MNTFIHLEAARQHRCELQATASRHRLFAGRVGGRRSRAVAAELAAADDAPALRLAGERGAPVPRIA